MLFAFDCKKNCFGLQKFYSTAPRMHFLLNLLGKVFVVVFSSLRNDRNGFGFVACNLPAVFLQIFIPFYSKKSFSKD